MQVVDVRYYGGYEVRAEHFTKEDPITGGGPGFTMWSAYTKNGAYIGDPVWAWRLASYGIRPEVADYPRRCTEEEANDRCGYTCSIGFSKRLQRWFGWSHRAWHGFAVGDKVTSSSHLCATSGWTDEYLEQHPEADMSLPVGFVAQTLDDCKKMAMAFAEAVS